MQHLPARGEVVLFDRSWYNRAGVGHVMGFCTDAEHEVRFKSRLEDPMPRWKLSPDGLESIIRWEEYSRAKDDMLVHTDISEAPWYIVESENKRRARAST